MKKILLLTLAATLTAFSIALADDSTVTIAVTKAGDTTAKVVTWPGDKNPTVVPITFADGTSWSDVRDSYDVAPDVATGLDNKKMCIMVNSDGGISFKSITPMASKDSSKKTK